MRKLNLKNLNNWLWLIFNRVRFIVVTLVSLLVILFIVLSFDKEKEEIGWGVVVGCSPVRNNFFVGEIHRSSVRVGRVVIENVRLKNCQEKRRVSVIRKHKHWGFKSIYAANYLNRN